MDSKYIYALEQRSRWLRWAKDEMPKLLQDYAPGKAYWRTGLPAYIDVLESGDTFYMNPKFCELVEHARDTVPDDLRFESEWMQAPQGWLWIAYPFEVPPPEEVERNSEKIEKLITNANANLEKMTIAAVGWRPVQEGLTTAKGMSGDVAGRVAGKGAYQFCTFISVGSNNEGFGCWSYFMLQEGDKLVDRINTFEQVSQEVGGAYKPGREASMKHEIRWVYSAFYLMAQRLAINVQHDTDRNTRRRAEFQKLKVTPFIRVITLRRMEEARKKDPSGNAPDWQFQWTVRGHWRNQWYASENTHKPVFVESYVKGPEGKPLKSPGIKLFVAGR